MPLLVGRVAPPAGARAAPAVAESCTSASYCNPAATGSGTCTLNADATACDATPAPASCAGAGPAADSCAVNSAGDGCDGAVAAVVAGSTSAAVDAGSTTAASAATCGAGNDLGGTPCAVNANTDGCEVTTGQCSFVPAFAADPPADIAADPPADVAATTCAFTPASCVGTATGSATGWTKTCPPVCGNQDGAGAGPVTTAQCSAGARLAYNSQAASVACADSGDNTCKAGAADNTVCCMAVTVRVPWGA